MTSRARLAPPSKSHRPSMLIDPHRPEWRVVPGFECYEVSERGHVRRRATFGRGSTGRLLKLRCNRFGYVTAKLYREGRPHDVFVHRLVVWAFIGPKPSPFHEVAHADGNKQNNHRTNLRWATKSENCLQKREHGAIPDIRGEKHPGAKLTEEIVHQLRRRRREGAFFREIAEEFGIPKLTVWDAVSRKTWSHI